MVSLYTRISSKLVLIEVEIMRIRVMQQSCVLTLFHPTCYRGACCHSCHHSLFLSFPSPLPAIQQLICGKFLTHYTLCNVYTPTIMEVIDGRLKSDEWVKLIIHVSARSHAAEVMTSSAVCFL